jgi:signal transduction histidine kinase/ActR/RegA family two-component response regulator
MRRWFSAQPIHRKLVLTSMAKTTVVLFAAMLSLLVVDSWRFHRGARADAVSLARIVAGNIQAAMYFDDVPFVRASLDGLRLRPQVERACAYGREGRLVAQYAREPAFVCPPIRPSSVAWSALAGDVPVEQNGQVVGSVYVERDWDVLRDRLVAAGITSLVVLVLASGVMLVVSDRLHGAISEPITRLASAARQMGQADDYEMPRIAAAQDEVGELVGAFGAMVERVKKANLDLTQTNGRLRREIEERRAIEAEREALLLREQQSNRLKDEFLATVSHELRTPLNAIVGWARILSTAPPDSATITKAAASLHRNAQTQARVIDDLIDISRIVTGKLRVTAEPVDLRGVVDAAVEASRPAAEHAGITLRLDLPSAACIIKGDRDRLQQVVSNLLSNAVKFAPGGAVNVALVPDGEDLVLTVSDNGVGIPPEFLDHVFDRFRQADSTITREHGGLGIGLAVVKELVELHGGSIRASSQGRGKGAEFSVRLPCYAGDMPVDTSEERVPSLAGISVLAVDDNDDALEILDLTLTKAGAEVRVAASGAEALELWREQPSDVLLCDLAMPHMSGFQLLSHIRDLDHVAGRVTPAIALTAHVTEEQVARSARAGFQMHIAKPFDINRLIRSVSAVRTRV